MVDLNRVIEFIGFDPIADKIILHVRTSGNVDGKRFNSLDTQASVQISQDVCDKLVAEWRKTLDEIVQPAISGDAVAAVNVETTVAIKG